MTLAKVDVRCMGVCWVKVCCILCYIEVACHFNHLISFFLNTQPAKGALGPSLAQKIIVGFDLDWPNEDPWPINA